MMVANTAPVPYLSFFLNEYCPFLYLRLLFIKIEDSRAREAARLVTCLLHRYEDLSLVGSCESTGPEFLVSNL